ncbi:two-component system regulatory protein YycI [Virgibacillus sp. NKC19-16]|uniref:two-component system activity regulator YycH n=1 Tax=Virgibacillus salidurans TaxID=2831673 RepID=UPI001F3C0056|nr:two-component system activity regulator YycH [Virgibacillus sp. NKC19-16]UJL46377.1 two-component system regulatory protein YycI [Virgibacillus sp. NKC19-16]
MKLETVKTFILVILIGLSLLLTFGLWNYQPNYETQNQSSVINEVDIGGSGDETISTIVEPSEIIFHANNQHFGYSNPSDLLNMYQDMQSWEMSNFETSETEGRVEQNYEVEVIFPEDLPMEIVNQIFTFNEDIEEFPSWSFDRMYFTFDEETASLRVEFVSIDGRQQARAVINASDHYRQLWNTITSREELSAYVLFDEGESPIYIPEESKTMEQLSAVAISGVHPNNMVNALFPNPSLVSESNTSVTGSGESYYSDAQRGMTVEQFGSSMEYINPQSTGGTQSGTAVELLDRSILNINEHNGWTEDYKLTDLQSSAGHVGYRMYYLGYPVFNNADLAMIEQEWQNQALTKYTRPLFLLNDTLDSHSVELPSGNDVIYFLQNRLSPNYELGNIQDLELGYRMTVNRDYVSLEPTWYMKYNEGWYAIEDIAPSEGGFKMDWSKIKTLFIICFLILNAYLLFQFLNKQEQANLSVLEDSESPITDQLESENITLGDIGVDITEESYISTGQKTFTEQERDQLEGFDNQTSEVINNNLILSAFEDPVPIPDDASQEEINAIVEDEILLSENYVFGEWNTEKNVLLFFQVTNDLPVYLNQSGIVLIFLDDENNMQFYTQTMLGEVETQGEKRTLIEPMRAIETLYTRNQLFPDEEISNVNIGFYTRVPLENNEQVFAPTYKVAVNEGSDEQIERDYFVNAIEGTIFNSEESAFLNDTIGSIISSVRTLDDESEIKDPVLNVLESREENNRSEGENDNSF